MKLCSASIYFLLRSLKIQFRMLDIFELVSSEKIGQWINTLSYSIIKLAGQSPYDRYSSVFLVEFDRV